MKSGNVISRCLSIAFVSVAVFIASACSTMSEDKDFKVVSFSAPGCSHTKAPDGNYTVERFKVGTLHLKSEDGNLKVTLSGLEDNCIITEGYDCSAVIDDSIIYVYVTAKELEMSANCFCAVDDIETVLTGLGRGRYTLEYNYRSGDMNIVQDVTFDFSPFLNKKVNFIREVHAVYD